MEKDVLKCSKCNSTHLQKDGNHKGNQRYKCMECKNRFDFGEYKINHLNHFNTKIKLTPYNKLTRDNYCIPTNKISYVCRKGLDFAIKRFNYKIPDEYYIDKETYTDEYVQQHYNDCMKNFDLNMSYFSKLNYEKFNKSLNSFLKKNKKFKEIFDLNQCKEESGIYILVLDEYKQVYIGVSENIKNRILQHWSAKKEFDRLIWGKIENSILSIDSFGALDTTRIFVMFENSYDAYLNEEKMVREFNQKYLLNRTAGGINNIETHNAELDIIANKKTRELI